MNSTINTVAGTITPEQLGCTLIHEHLFVQYGGATAEMQRPGPLRREIEAVCIDYIGRIRACGVESLVDPTTVDLGRNIPLMAELAARTGLHIICAAGIYSTAAYRDMRRRLGGSPDAVAEHFIAELTDGIGDTGIKAGIIKVVTGQPAVGSDEQELLCAAAKASAATGAPIITHTEGILGDEQQKILTGAGVPAHRIIIGHSCLSTDFAYHRRLVQGGSYLGFDRFGMPGMTDEARAASLTALIQAGCASRLLVSHDSVWYWVGGPRLGSGPYKHWTPTTFFERIIPLLRSNGVTDEQIQVLVCENPQRFFAGELP